LFAKIAGIPVFVRSLMPFRNICENRIVLVVPPKLKDSFKKISRKFCPNVNIKYADGGRSRTDSVANGLEAISSLSLDLVAIHDAARPLIKEGNISLAFRFAAKHGSAIVSSRISDTIKFVNKDNKILKTVDREYLISAQTPQIFKFNEIKRAYQKISKIKKSFSDDASVMEFLGQNVKVFITEDPNIKITYPKDLKLANALMSD